jgi:DoxX-like family
MLRITIERSFSMNTNRNWQKIGGWVLHGLVAGIMILAGSAKVVGLFPPEEVAKLGLDVPIQVIGAGELASAILLLFPRTSSLGLLLTSRFWGGAICLHMSKAEPFVIQPVFLVITWVGGYLRVPGAFGSFAARSHSKQECEHAVEALTV